MTISAQTRAEIRRLFFGEHWPVGTIANHLGVHHSTVKRAIDSDRFARKGAVRASALDPYVGFVRETLAEYPKLTATRMHDMLRLRGYSGSVVQLRRRIRSLGLRPRPRSEAFFIRRVFPGEEAQVDWGYFGQIQVDGALRKLWLFVITLSWSRAFDVSFSLEQNAAAVLRGHLAGFDHFGGVPRRILYDNMKTVVIERVGDAVRFHPRLLELSGHYAFGAYPCAPRRGNEKGRVERRIKDLRHSFMAGRRFVDLADLREQFVRWRREVAYARPCPADPDATVREALGRERARLLRLPDNPLDCDDVRTTIARKQPYVRYDTNRYSVPHELVGEPLTLSVSDAVVRVLHGDREVARHPRSWARHQIVDRPEHLAGLAEHKRKARALHGRALLLAAVPEAEPLLMHLADRDEAIGPQTSKLLELVQEHGAEAVGAAIDTAMQRGTPRAASVARLLDQQRRAAGEPPKPGPLRLRERPDLEELHITQHDLEDYDELIPNPDDSGDAAS